MVTKFAATTADQGHFFQNPSSPVCLPIPDCCAQLFQLHVWVSSCTKYFTVSQCSSTYIGLLGMDFSFWDLSLWLLHDLATPDTSFSIGSPKSAAPESLSYPFSSTSWTSSLLSCIASLDIEFGPFLVQFTWIASITLLQSSEMTCGGEESNWSVAWIQNPWASSHLYYI